MNERQEAGLERVDRLNSLLAERARTGREVQVALGISYLSHAIVVLAMTLLFSRSGHAVLLPPSPGGVLPVHALYGLPDAVPVPQEVESVSPPPPPPPSPKAATIREREKPKPKPTATRKPKPKPKRTPKRRPTPSAEDRARAKQAKQAAKMLRKTDGRPGSITGVLGGDERGGLGSLMFSNQWYVSRIRDIVYKNWGNPFVGRETTSGLEVVVSFVIDRNGRLSNIEMTSRSGDARWDRAGLRAVENSRLPPLPADYPGTDLKVFYRFIDEGSR